MSDPNPLKSDECLESLLEEIKNGSRSSAFEMIHKLNQKLKDDPSSIPKPVRDWLADSLIDIAFNNISGKAALGLTGKAKLEDPNHPIQITIDQVYWYIKSTGLPIHKSGTSPSAFRDAAKKFNISASTAEKYYYFAERSKTFVDENFLRDIVGLTDDEIQNS